VTGLEHTAEGLTNGEIDIRVALVLHGFCGDGIFNHLCKMTTDLRLNILTLFIHGVLIDVF
jgi:hypothetical protein